MDGEAALGGQEGHLEIAKGKELSEAVENLAQKAAKSGRITVDTPITNIVSDTDSFADSVKVDPKSQFFHQLLEPHNIIDIAAQKAIASKVTLLLDSDDDGSQKKALVDLVNTSKDKVISDLSGMSMLRTKRKDAVQKKGELLEHIVNSDAYRKQLMPDAPPPSYGVVMGGAGGDRAAPEDPEMAAALAASLASAESDQKQEYVATGVLSGDLAEKIPSPGLEGYAVINPKGDGNCWLRAAIFVAANELASDPERREAVKKGATEKVDALKKMMEDHRTNFHPSAQYSADEIDKLAAAFNHFVDETAGKSTDKISELLENSSQMESVHRFMRLNALQAQMEIYGAPDLEGKAPVFNDFEGQPVSYLSFPKNEGTVDDLSALGSLFGGPLYYVSSERPDAERAFGEYEDRWTTDPSQMWIVHDSRHMMVAVPNRESALSSRAGSTDSSSFDGAVSPPSSDPDSE